MIDHSRSAGVPRRLPERPSGAGLADNFASTPPVPRHWARRVRVSEPVRFSHHCRRRPAHVRSPRRPPPARSLNRPPREILRPPPATPRPRPAADPDRPAARRSGAGRSPTLPGAGRGRFCRRRGGRSGRRVRPGSPRVRLQQSARGSHTGQAAVGVKSRREACGRRSPAGCRGRRDRAGGAGSLRKRGPEPPAAPVNAPEPAFGGGEARSPLHRPRPVVFDPRSTGTFSRLSAADPVRAAASSEIAAAPRPAWPSGGAATESLDVLRDPPTGLGGGRRIDQSPVVARQLAAAGNPDIFSAPRRGAAAAAPSSVSPRPASPALDDVLVPLAADYPRWQGDGPRRLPGGSGSVDRLRRTSTTCGPSVTPSRPPTTPPAAT